MQIVFRESNLLGLTAVERRELERRGPTGYSDLRVRILLDNPNVLFSSFGHSAIKSVFPLPSQTDCCSSLSML
jgi:hypothetical protein